MAREMAGRTRAKAETRTAFLSVVGRHDEDRRVKMAEMTGSG